MGRVNVSNKAKIVVVCGASGSGKSAWTKKQITRAKRLLIWDIDDEYTGERINKQADLVAKLRTEKAGVFRYVGKAKDFSFFCKCAFAWGRCTVVAEEIAGVTSPGKAPEGWHMLVSRGRKRGISIYAVTQRPSESDKTVFGNASALHVGRMTRKKDRVYIAGELDCKVDILDDLQPLDYVHREMSTGKVTTGRIHF
jgi:hypothetical protein